MDRHVAKSAPRDCKGHITKKPTNPAISLSIQKNTIKYKAIKIKSENKNGRGKTRYNFRCTIKIING